MGGTATSKPGTKQQVDMTQLLTPLLNVKRSEHFILHSPSVITTLDVRGTCLLFVVFID